MANPRQEWRVSCGHWVVIRTFAMPRAYLRSTKHVQNFKDPVIRSLRCMAGSVGAWRCVSLRYKGDGVVSITSSVSASTKSLARIFALGWSKVHSISIILHPRLDILLQVNHSLGEADFPPGLFATLYPNKWWTNFWGWNHIFLWWNHVNPQILCLESARNQETIKALVEGRIWNRPWNH